MAYDEHLADRIREVFEEKDVAFIEKRMMGGLCFMVDGKMCCGIHFDKKKQLHVLLARVGPLVYEEALKKEGASVMDFTGRVMKNFVCVDYRGFDEDEDLTYWIDLCLAYNPLAKRRNKEQRAKNKE